MHFSIIVAHDRVRGIGKAGTLPWKIASDMKFFKQTTIGAGNNCVIMGRLTWQSIPKKFRPLPDRSNVVLTSDPEKFMQDNQGDPLAAFTDLDTALAYAEREKFDRVFVIGGAQIYAIALNHPGCEMLYVTSIDREYGCDVFLPEYRCQYGLQPGIVTEVGDHETYELQRWHRRKEALHES